MQNNAKRRLAGGVLYVFLAFMLVTLLCVGLLTALTGGLGRAKETSVPESTAPVTEKTAEPEKDSEPDTVKPGAAEPADEPDAPIDAIPYAYCMPVEGYLSKPFDIEQAVYSLTMDDYRVHGGIDVEGEVGTEVAAFADGTVSYVTRDPFMGYCVCLEHSGGMKSYYMNLTSDIPAELTAGSEVSCGQIIGYVGDSAALEAAQTPHLHFEVTVNGKKVDPLDYLDYDPSLYPTDSEAEG